MNHYFTNNKDLKSNIQVIKTTILNTELSLNSDNGVFSREKIDYGTRLLLNTINLDRIINNTLDLGCGYGVIGIYIKKNSSTSIDMVDISERALSLTRRNVELNNLRDIRVFESDAYSNIESEYDLIITNPPIRVGKVKILEILRGANDHLNANGELWFVMRKDHGVLSIIKLIEDLYNIEIMDKDKGFYIVKCTSR